ncbi:hypothetical protein FRC17_001817 [Serendipita sp. 399]|nr:hypothetical protein FRC17_001817 [Serendipita sp. 399]
MATNGFHKPSKNPSDIQDYHRRLVGFCLDSMGEAPLGVSYFRDLAKEEPATTLKVPALKQMAKDMKSRHEKELEEIYDFQANERMRLLKEHRAALDGGDFHPNPDIGDRPKGGSTDLNKGKFSPLPPHLWAASIAINQQSNMFSDTVERFDHAFLQGELLPVHRECTRLESQINLILPTSLEEFKAVSYTHQVRVAKLLSGTGSIWPGASENPSTYEALQAAYTSNPEFQAEVRKLLESIKGTDPRRNTKSSIAPKNF